MFFTEKNVRILVLLFTSFLCIRSCTEASVLPSRGKDEGSTSNNKNAVCRTRFFSQQFLLDLAQLNLDASFLESAGDEKTAQVRSRGALDGKESRTRQEIEPETLDSVALEFSLYYSCASSVWTNPVNREDTDGEKDHSSSRVFDSTWASPASLPSPLPSRASDYDQRLKNLEKNSARHCNRWPEVQFPIDDFVATTSLSLYTLLTSNIVNPPTWLTRIPGEQPVIDIHLHL